MSFLSRILNPPPRTNPVREAEKRWTAHNTAARAAGCPCGQPATEVRHDHRNVGNVPVETWTCTEHVGAEMWADGRPAWGHDRKLPGVECWGTAGPIGGEPTRWFHPVKPAEAALAVLRASTVDAAATVSDGERRPALDAPRAKETPFPAHPDATPNGAHHAAG